MLRHNMKRAGEIQGVSQLDYKLSSDKCSSLEGKIKLADPLNSLNSLNLQAGVTLIELIISMIIISIALVGILSVVNQTTVHSADPIVNHQAIAIAESYLEEILLLSYKDPETPVNPIGADPSETRAVYDDVDDYDGINNEVPKNQNAEDLDGAGGRVDLSTYKVTVNVTVLSAPPELVGMKEVNVTVTRGTTSISIKGYRADYL